MEKKNLTITVSGEPKSGKSHLIFLLKSFLKTMDFEVEFNGGIDYEDESHFDEYMNNHFYSTIKNFKRKTKIFLKEKNIKEIENKALYYELDGLIEKAISLGIDIDFVGTHYNPHHIGITNLDLIIINLQWDIEFIKKILVERINRFIEYKKTLRITKNI